LIFCLFESLHFNSEAFSMPLCSKNIVFCVEKRIEMVL
jgi:hypothetical protein